MIRCACGFSGARVCYICEQNSARAKGLTQQVKPDVELNDVERLRENLARINASVLERLRGKQ